MKRVEIIIRTINGDTPPTEKIVAELTASGNKIECVIPIVFRTAFICLPKASTSAFGIITSIVLYRSDEQCGTTLYFP